MICYDEADEIFLQESNQKAVKSAHQHLEKINVKPQFVLFSATFNDDIMKIIQEHFTSIEAFTVTKEALKLQGVKMFRMQVPILHEFSKVDVMTEVYDVFDVFQTMIFVNKKKDAEMLKKHLNEKGIKAEMLIGKMDGAARDKIIDKFRSNEINSLLCTNVLARGIDVPEVDLVINYDVPFISDFGYKLPDHANFLHRVGRTGRFGTDGCSLTLTTDETEEDLLDQIQDYYKIKIDKI